jgi:hypothetical protein
MARLLARMVDGAPLAELQVLGEVGMAERGSVRSVSPRREGNGSLTEQSGGVS